MSSNNTAFLILITLALLTSLGVFALTARSLRKLLTEIVTVPACAIFFTRSLMICLISVSLSDAIGQKFDLGANAALMEYMLKIAPGLSPIFLHACLFLLGYLVLVTVIVAVRGGRNE
jgi:hypothetical protein